MSPEILLEQYGAWGIIAILSYMLLKFVLIDLRRDQEAQTKELLRNHDKEYQMICKIHDRLDRHTQKIEKATSIIERLNGHK